MPVKQNISMENSSLPKNIASDEDSFQLFDILGQGVVNLSASAVIISINQPAAQMFACTVQDVIGRKFTELAGDFIHEDTSPFTGEELSDHLAMTGKTISTITMGFSPHHTHAQWVQASTGALSARMGTYRWVKVTAIPKFESGKDKPLQVCVILEDITEQKQIERRLHERKKELQAFYSITRLTDLDELTLDDLYQRVIEFLPKSWQHPEISCGKITIEGKEFSTNNFQDTPWKQTSSIKIFGAVKGAMTIAYLTEMPTEDEGPFFTEERLLLDSISEWLGRITERKQTALILHQKNEFIELALQSASLGTWQQHFDQNIMVLDEIACLHFGFYTDQNRRATSGTHTVTQQDIIQRIHPDDLQRFLNDYQAVLTTGNTNPINIQHRIIHPDGTIKWLEIHARIK